MNNVGFVSFNLNNSQLRKSEKKAESANNLITGAAASGIVAGTVGATEIAKHAKMPAIELPKKAPKAVINVQKKVDKAATQALKTASEIAEKPVIKPAVEMASSAGKKVSSAAKEVSGAAKKIAGKVQNYVKAMPKPVKVAAGLATVGLAASHIHRDGQIKGSFEGIRTINDANQAIKDKFQGIQKALTLGSENK